MNRQGLRIHAIWMFYLALAFTPPGRAIPTDEPPGDHEILYYDGPDATGALSGGRLLVPRTPRAALLGQAPTPSRSTTILLNGPVANRIDLVTVGDGYVAGELGLYHTHASNGISALLAAEPFATYASFFNVHVIDVVSNESGVDNDPTEGIERDTALDMGFWCGGTERLLCVDVGKAYAHANNAPEVDHVLAVGNSTKYGGAGYSGSDLATYSGGNTFATEVAIHEFGHSLGNLGDEYFSPGTTYSGPEPPEPNVSISVAAAMASSGTKWAAWLGDPGLGFGGLVDTYEGAYEHAAGIYRPTITSKMRSLGQPFNLPSVEALILEFYRIVDPIDASTPADTVSATDTLFVTPLHPVGHALDVQWFLDEAPLAEANTEMLALADLGVASGLHEVSVKVVDNTSWVRDEAQRATIMTASRSWVLDAGLTSAAYFQEGSAAGLAVRVAPNPVTVSTAVHVQLERQAPVDVRVFDSRGRLVRVLSSRHAPSRGANTFRWDTLDAGGRPAATGIYYVRVLAGSEAAVSRAVLLR